MDAAQDKHGYKNYSSKELPESFCAFHNLPPVTYIVLRKMTFLTTIGSDRHVIITPIYFNMLDFNLLKTQLFHVVNKQLCCKYNNYG